ncbi:MAG: PilN domain-containing protein [Burkholderiales bacterium]|nr:PilN domain-containing protein [Burkholderiales bacterium]
MILINLLPHREAARKRRRELFLFQLLFALLVGLLLVGAVALSYQARIDSQRDRNDLFRAEIALLDAQIKEVASLKTQVEALKARQQAVERLQADRNLPVHLLEEMVKQVPDGVYLSSLKQEGSSIVIAGMAQSQERVSELLRNLGNHSAWLRQPQLVEIVAGEVNVPQRGTRRVSNFSIRVALVRSQEAEAHPSAAKPDSVPAGKV